MSKQRTQTERVIAAARSYRGITAVDFLLPDVVDGGPPITRLGARLFDAEEEGYTFERIGKRDRCVIYRLVSEPGVEGDGGVHPDGEPANPSARRPTRPTEHAGTTVALNADVDDGRRGSPESEAFPFRPLCGTMAAPAAVVSADTLFEPEPEKPSNPYDYERAA